MIHDWSLERLADSPLVVEESPAARLLEIELQADPEVAPDGRRIPNLATALAALPERLPVNLELKRRNADPERLVEAVLAHLPLHPRCWISSFDWELLELLRVRRRDLPLAPLARRRSGDAEAAAERLGAVALHVRTTVASRALVQRQRRRGRPLLCYTVNDAGQARRLLDAGIAGLFTDRPAPLRRELGLPGGPG